MGVETRPPMPLGRPAPFLLASPKTGSRQGPLTLPGATSLVRGGQKQAGSLPALAKAEKEAKSARRQPQPSFWALRREAADLSTPACFPAPGPGSLSDTLATNEESIQDGINANRQTGRQTDRQAKSQQERQGNRAPTLPLSAGIMAWLACAPAIRMNEPACSLARLFQSDIRF